MAYLSVAANLTLTLNTFLGEVPQESGAPPVPVCAEKLVSEFYSQGLQREPLRALPEKDQAAMGVWNGAMGRDVRAFLFMDDTTLLAKTASGLKAMSARYVAYCKKLRMRLNASKSKIMHFSALFLKCFFFLRPRDDAPQDKK